MALSEEQREKRRQQMRALNAAKTPEQRTAAGRKGGQATYAKVGKAGMSELGKKGFARALETVGGHTLYEILGASYRAKYGRDPVRLLSKEEMQRRTRIRAQARR